MSVSRPQKRWTRVKSPSRSALGPGSGVGGLYTVVLGRKALSGCWPGTATLRVMPTKPVVEPFTMAAGERARRLSGERCRALLARSSSGHLALSQGALPLVVPVTYALDREQLLVRAGLFLIVRAPLPGVVAFHTGGTTLGDGCVWEVMVQGRGEVIDDVPAPNCPPQLPLVAADLTTVLRINMDLMTGWQYGQGDPGPGTQVTLQ